MALANLTVGADLDAAFRAETPAPLAVLKIRVTGTVIELDPEGGAAAAAAADPSATLESLFAQLHAEAVAAKDATEAAKRASMWLLRQGPGGEGKWTLLRCARQRARGGARAVALCDVDASLLPRSCVPDDVHPKTKMMYAAARDDTKRSLDPARFSHDYHVVEAEDVTAAAFADWADRRRETAMSAAERRAAEDSREAAAGARSGPVKAMAMGTVPFELGADAQAALTELLAGGAAAAAGSGGGGGAASLGAVALSVTSAGVGSAAGVAAADALAGGAPALAAWMEGVVEATASGGVREPRFFALRLGAGRLGEAATAPEGGSGGGAEEATLPVIVHAALVFHCPEASAPRTRMLYASAKAGLASAAERLGLSFARTVETRDADDLQVSCPPSGEGVLQSYPARTIMRTPNRSPARPSSSPRQRTPSRTCSACTRRSGAQRPLPPQRLQRPPRPRLRPSARQARTTRGPRPRPAASRCRAWGALPCPGSAAGRPCALSARGTCGPRLPAAPRPSAAAESSAWTRSSLRASRRQRRRRSPATSRRATISVASSLEATRLFRSLLGQGAARRASKSEARPA